jgi:chemotaxis protein methyltransferase CheR
VEFLRWALPRLHLSWRGFRKVRRQVCRRVECRREELGLADVAAYRAHLEERTEEWVVLDGLCRVTISRFYRDRGLWDFLEREALPELAAGAAGRGDAALEAWSAGCASGEEPYTLAVIWALAPPSRFPELELRVLATDVDEAVLRRAREACYAASSLRDVPESWRRRAFVERDGLLCLRPELARGVTFARHDVRDEPPGGPFDLVLCRNLAFTYFDIDLQLAVENRIASCLRPGGALVLGAHERLPAGVPELASWSEPFGVFRKCGADHSLT